MPITTMFMKVIQHHHHHQQQSNRLIPPSLDKCLKHQSYFEKSSEHVEIHGEGRDMEQKFDLSSQLTS